MDFHLNSLELKDPTRTHSLSSKKGFKRWGSFGLPSTNLPVPGLPFAQAAWETKIYNISSSDRFPLKPTRENKHILKQLEVVGKMYTDQGVFLSKWNQQ